MRELKIIVPKNFIDVGRKINVNLNKLKGTTGVNYIIEPELIRFNNGVKF